MKSAAGFWRRFGARISLRPSAGREFRNSFPPSERPPLEEEQEVVRGVRNRVAMVGAMYMTLMIGGVVIGIRHPRDLVIKVLALVFGLLMWGHFRSAYALYKVRNEALRSAALSSCLGGLRRLYILRAVLLVLAVTATSIVVSVMVSFALELA